MATPTILAATPVVTSRQWSTGLAPRNGGGWMFITQAFNYDNDVPTEWITIQIEEGVVTVTEGPNRIASNTNFQVPSANTLVTTSNQLRAPNGRIFFPEFATPGPGFDDAVNVAYYDPTDELIHQLPEIVDPTGDRQAIVYQMVFNRLGTALYGGTQSQIGNTPMIFQLDPVTLVATYLASVGTASGQPKYAYYLAKDEGPGADFLYVAVGQDGWEIVCIDLTDNSTTTLLTTVGPGMQFVEFEVRAEGWSANTISNGVQTRYWMADGALSAYPGSGAPPGGARVVTPYTNPLIMPPEIDWSRGIGHFLWRPFGSTEPFTEITYEVAYTGPVALESLAALRNRELIGNATQYNGFWNYVPHASSATWYGNWPLGASSVVLCVVDDDEVYIGGYPNGALFLYDPTAPWVPDGTATSNPRALGNYGTNVRYPYFLVLAANDRLYTAGRQERDDDGSGVGYYDVVGETFHTEDDNLSEYIPRGFVVLEEAGLCVFSGELMPGAIAPEAQLVVYDLDLNEVTRWTVEAGLQNTGLLCTTDDPEVVFGLTNDNPVMIYRFNVVTGQLLDSEVLGAVAPVGGYAKRIGDEALWVDLAQDLVRIDVDTLEHRTIVDLEISTQYFAWSGRALYMVADTELRYLNIGGAMPIIVLPIPAPAGNGTGAAVDTSDLGPFKTVMVSGDWGFTPPTVNVEINNHPAAADGSWAPLCSFQGRGMQQVKAACLWIRARVSNWRGGQAPVVNVGSNEEGCDAILLDVPTADGVGDAVDVSGLDIFKTAWVGDVFTGVLDIEISCDENGDHFATLWSFLQPGAQNAEVAATWARVRRAGVTNSSVPMVAIGGAPTI